MRDAPPMILSEAKLVCLVVWGFGLHLLVLFVLFDDFPLSRTVLYEAPGVRVDAILLNRGISEHFIPTAICCLNLLWRVGSNGSTCWIGDRID